MYTFLSLSLSLSLLHAYIIISVELWRSFYLFFSLAETEKEQQQQTGSLGFSIWPLKPHLNSFSLMAACWKLAYFIFCS